MICWSTNLFKNQIELEEYLADTCYSEALSRLQEGFKRNSVYADVSGVLLMNRFLCSVEEYIKLFKTANRPKQYAMLDYTLLKPYPNRALAVLALYLCLDYAYKNESMQEVCNNLGKAVFSEFIMRKIKEGSPEAWYDMINNPYMKLHEASETDSKALLRVCKDLGIPIDKWNRVTRIQVGARLLEACVKAGACEIRTEVIKLTTKSKAKKESYICLTQPSKELMAQLKARILSVGLVRTPFVEEPKPWIAYNSGGFHTATMKRKAPFCIKAKGNMRLYYKENPKALDPVLRTLNILQSVPYKVNNELLIWLEKFYKDGFKVPEIPDREPEPEPVFVHGYKEQFTAQEAKDWAQHKRAWREWREKENKRIAMEYRLARLLQDAKLFADQEKIYFRYTADGRGRVYAESDSMNPQGSDLQKAMTLFYEGCKLDSPEAIKWFKINIANRYGFDKASLEERVKWVDENSELLIACAQDPISFSDWREADSPWQFLVCCMEYYKWKIDPANFTSHVPCGLDGSCNGLQNYSALLRDEIGGFSVNLRKAHNRQDIYQLVADEAWRLIKLDNSDDPDNIRKRWLEHVPKRLIAKRITMTLVYGAVKHSCFQFIMKEYIDAGYITTFSPYEKNKACLYVSEYVWKALENIVVKAREGMDWLREVAKVVVESGASEIRWTTPSGLEVSQCYPTEDRITAHCYILKRRQLTLWRPNYNKPKKMKNIQAIAPNVIHSVDASHMAAVASRAKAVGIDSLAMIHDDFGTLANRTEELYHIIREEFVKMHESHDVLQDIYERYKHLGIPKPPEKGKLDIREVLESEYFFS